MKRNKVLGLIFVILLLILYVLLRPVNVLIIKNYHDNQILFRKKVKPGYSFATLIKHSVHKSPVFEYYQVDRNGTILIKGTALQDLGWGVPSTFDYDFRFENDMMVITNVNKPIEFLPFRVSYIAEPHLILNKERDIDLTEVVDNHERIDVMVEKQPYFIYVLRGEVDVFQEKTCR